MRPGLVGVEELRLIAGTGVPPGPVEQPATLGQWPVRLGPLPDVLDLEQEVGIGGGVRGPVEDYGRTHQAAWGDLGDGLAVPAGGPVDQSVEVGAGGGGGVEGRGVGWVRAPVRGGTGAVSPAMTTASVMVRNSVMGVGARPMPAPTPLSWPWMSMSQGESTVPTADPISTAMSASRTVRVASVAMT